MITASTNLKDLFYQSQAINISAGCTIEYNMNMMLDNIAITTSVTDSNYVDMQQVGVNPFKKLFPLDSILKPFRPINSGIKYYIISDTDHSGANKFYNFRSIPYPENAPRVYYPGISTYYKYWLTPSNTQADVTVKYLQDSIPTTKAALSNKIIIRFEKFHTLPANCTVLITHKDNTTQSITATPASSGTLILYHNGTTWSTTAPFTSTQPIYYPAPKEVKEIKLTVPAAGVDRAVGVIEISARWIKDISSDVISFSINKESTSDPQDILPVGNITANNLNINLAKYNQSELKVVTYNRDSSWVSVPDDVIYFTKNAEMKPHFKVYHSNGTITEGSSKYDIVEQGSYFIDSHSIGQYGDVDVSALDGSKQLMETIIPDLVYKQAPVTSIIMSMLDAVGFSNYKINTLIDNSGNSIDTSIPTLGMWWSQDNKTVWQCLQELCRDIQMNAFFDENNILQFYSRDYLYSKSTVDWEFYHSQNGNKLPNIIDFDKQELNFANQVKILWQTPMSGQYLQNSTILWKSENTFLVAGGLRNQIEESTPAASVEFNIDIDNIDPETPIVSTFGYSGYFLVDSEIFEYDAIEYEYVPVNASTSDAKQKVFVASESDWSKYRALSKTGSQYFQPTGKYRIKNRGVFGTKTAQHKATASIATNWILIEKDTWQ